MKKLAWMAVAALLAASPALALETLTVGFGAPEGAATTYKYDGTVRITVSGFGQAQGHRYNDAFYQYDPTPVEHNTNWYQLAFSTSPLTLHETGVTATSFIVGGLPAYNPSHVYSFLLNTGATSPTQLHFGVTDGMYTDNTGAYDIVITVPEPATWALMLAGFGLVGTALRRRAHWVAA